MTLLEEAGLLIDQAVDAARRGRTQAAVDYIRQARKLYEADTGAVAEECRLLAGQVEQLQTQLTTLVEAERIRGAQPDYRWQDPKCH